jgi:acetyltransferase-like isoleucine patch superfamily enzyme
MNPMHLEPRESLKAAMDTPWKAINEIRRLLWTPFIWSYFALHGVAWGSHWSVYGTPLIQRHRGSQIAIGHDFEMRNWFGANPLGVIHRCILATWSADAKIQIGNGVGMTGATLCAQTRILIGDHVNIGANSTITDTDFHPLAGRGSGPGTSSAVASPVVIEGDNFIGMHVLILKGSHIGKGAVIGAGSVVTGDVPPNVVVAGNPARVIREL